MPYSINSIKVSNADKVVAINWKYNNGKGQRGNTWELKKPYGDTPLKDCTEAVLIGWLEEQFPEGTTADLDRCIDQDIARKELEASIDTYTVSAKGAPMLVAEPETADLEEPAVAAMAAPATKTKAKTKK